MHSAHAQLLLAITTRCLGVVRAVAKVALNRVVPSLVLDYQTTPLRFFRSFLNMLCFIHIHVETIKKILCNILKLIFIKIT